MKTKHIILPVLMLSLTVISHTASGSTTPVIVGWGGPNLTETSDIEPSNHKSLVFPGEKAGNLEMQVRKLIDLGLNAVRVSFESQCTSWKEQEPYSSENLERAFAVAERFQFWIIVDYHGYNDTATNTTIDCWLNFWSVLVQQFSSRYTRTVWEPINEPTGIGYNHAAVNTLSNIYQRWIDQTRLLGDTNWVVVQNLCSFRCDFDNQADGFPTLTDPAGRLFISLHSYMGYLENSGSWNNATAETIAQTYYQAVLDGSSRTGWPVLNTEGGADPLCHSCAPDALLTGSAGYTAVTLHFIQKLTSLYDNNSPQRINWVWWTMGSWTDTPGAGIYGALDTWGGTLDYRMVRPPITGDVNKDFLIDARDLAIVALAYNSTPSSKYWAIEADITHDNIVDILDIAIVAWNYGSSY